MGVHNGQASESRGSDGRDGMVYGHGAAHPRQAVDALTGQPMPARPARVWQAAPMPGGTDVAGDCSMSVPRETQGR
jgi:hypothetical protein